MKNSFLIGNVDAIDTSIPIVSTELNSDDLFGAVKVRLGIKREKFRVDPGLYAFGKPDQSSDVFVTANYKLSFDTPVLRTF